MAHTLLIDTLLVGRARVNVTKNGQNSQIYLLNAFKIAINHRPASRTIIVPLKNFSTLHNFTKTVHFELLHNTSYQIFIIMNLRTFTNKNNNNSHHHHATYLKQIPESKLTIHNTMNNCVAVVVVVVVEVTIGL